MQAVILAAGRGTRMGKFTDKISKPMLRIAGRPILEYTLSNLPDEISEIILIIGYKGKAIKKHFGDSHGKRKIKYVVQRKLNGTAGALYQAKNLLKKRFLVLNGDDLYHHDDIKKILPYDFGFLVKEIDKPGEFGVVKIDENGNLLDIIEKPKNPESNLANIGVYLLNGEIFKYKPVAITEKEFGLPQTLEKMAKIHNVKVGIEKAIFWQPIGYPKDIKAAEKIIHQFSSRL